jgi:hypothetical protein
MAAQEVGGVVLVIDAKNEGIAGWYASYGALPLADSPLSLVLPLATIEGALRSTGKSSERGGDGEKRSCFIIPTICP